MSPSTETTTSRWGRPLLTVAVLITCLRVWLGPIEWSPRAQAQIPDAGGQRMQLVTEARRTNDLLVELIALLKTQTIKVRVEGSDKTKAASPSPSAKRP